jgi:hypothetical protein
MNNPWIPFVGIIVVTFLAVIIACVSSLAIRRKIYLRGFSQRAAGKPAVTPSTYGHFGGVADARYLRVIGAEMLAVVDLSAETPEDLRRRSGSLRHP